MKAQLEITVLVVGHVDRQLLTDVTQRAPGVQFIATSSPDWRKIHFDCVLVETAFAQVTQVCADYGRVASVILLVPTFDFDANRKALMLGAIDILPADVVSPEWLLSSLSVVAWDDRAVSPQMVDNGLLRNTLRLLNSSMTIGNIYLELQTLMQKYFGSRWMYVFLYDDIQQLVTVLSSENQQPALKSRGRFLQPASSNDAATREKKLAIVPDMSADAIQQASHYPLDSWGYESGARAQIILPLFVGDELIGGLMLLWDQPQGYSREHFSLMLQIADAVAIAIRRGMLYFQTERTLRQTRSLFETSRGLIGLAGLPLIFESVLNGVRHALDCQLAVFITVDQRTRTVTKYKLEGGSIAVDSVRVTYEDIESGIARHVLQTGEPLISSKYVPHEYETIDQRQLRFDNGFGTMLLAPVVYQDIPFGIVAALRSADGPDFDQHDLDYLRTVTSQAAVAIVSNRLFNDHARQSEQLGLLGGLSTALRTVSDLNVALDIIVEQSQQFFEPDMVLLYLKDDVTNKLIAQRTYPAGVLPNALILETDQGLTGHIFQQRELVAVDDFQNHPKVYFPQGATSVLRNVVSSISFPLFADDDAVGVIHIAFNRSRPLQEGERELVRAMSNIMGSALQRCALVDSLEQRVARRNKELEERYLELSEANSRLQELDELKNRFVSDVSHELRTPVTSLRLYLDLMERRPEKSAHYLRIVRQEVDRLKGLVLDVLKISRFDLNRVQVSFGMLDLNALIEGEVDLYRERAEADGLTLHFESAQLPPFWGEPTQLSEMITNLLRNAISYTSAGSITVSTATLPNQQIQIQIVDTGMGIPDQDLGDVFGRFYRGRNASTVPGSGLGLTLVKEIVNLHQGAIIVESTLGEGTCVTINLPVLNGNA